MPTTRNQAVKAINEIQDGIGNKAERVRETLTKVLEYTESTPISNTEQQGSFHFFVSGIDEGRNKLESSLTGFKGEAGDLFNFNFELGIRKINDLNKYLFSLETDREEELKEIITKIQKNKLVFSFVVPVDITTTTRATNANAATQAKQHLPLSITITFISNSDGLWVEFDFLGFSSLPEMKFSSAKVKTTVCLHAPNS
ncbi:hypothetical protein [Lutibacter citreus]|uniref:hypothetical protein n=1 Tax=Lutibacter citreus TaxID=2138210 RepID=UPI000DBE1F1C|nr:hypothetical protein [Lutibacter citreus]